jgi:hypothetical protein
MVGVNPETGYFVGKSEFKDNSFQSEDCFPAAFGNYLLFRGFKREDAEHAITLLQSVPGFDQELHQGVRAIRMALSELTSDYSLDIVLHYNHPEDVIDDYKGEMGEVDIQGLALPVIALSRIESGLNHAWVMTKKTPLEGIDVDGEKDTIDYTIDGYYEIKGLERHLES